jgi:peptide/nickel transport system substrate-binding protein/dipeptide transport system substrate-binding protein
MFRFDLTQAKQLMKDAGYANGFSMKYYSFSQGDAPYMPDLNQVIQGYWQKIGVSAELVPIDYGVWKKIANTATNPQLIGAASMFSASFSPFTPTKLFPYYLKDKYALLSNPTIDDLAQRAYSELDPAKATALITEASKIILDSWVTIPTAVVPALAATGPMVTLDYPAPIHSLSMVLNLVQHPK